MLSPSSGAEALATLRERYESLPARERAVFDHVAARVAQVLPGGAALDFRTAAARDLERYVQYGQALLAVYRLVRRGIVPDPQIVEYLKDNLHPAMARSLAQSQTPSPTSALSTGSTGGGTAAAQWSRASLAQKILRDTTNKFSRLVNTTGTERGSPQQINFAVRLENLRLLQTILAKKFLKHSLRTPDQIYNFIVSSDAVATLSALTRAVVPGARATSLLNHFSTLVDRKEDVLVKLAALLAEPVSRINKQGAYQLPGECMYSAGGVNRIPVYVALSHFRRHKFPPGRLRLTKTIGLKDELTAVGRQWLETRSPKRAACAAVARQASTRISTRELKRQQEAEREQRERMKALRERNMDAYLSLVKNVKNQRIQEILENTEKLLQDIGAKVQVERVQNEERRKRDAEIAAEKARRREERKAARKAAAPAPPAPEPEVSSGQAREAKQPACLVGGKLMPYQLAGLEFLLSLYWNNLSGILADEMGLGKTIQTISLLAYLLEAEKNPGPHLVAVPLSTLPNWLSEFAKWCPSLRVLQYRGSKLERRELNTEVRRCRYNVLLTTFEYVLRERRVLGSVKWRFIIVDEGHKMKNVKSKFHATLGEFNSTHRLLLTGTPLQNNLNELWSLLNFLMPHTFSSGEDFERWFEEPFREQFGTPTANGTSVPSVALTEEEKLIVINRLHLVLRPFLLRRIKSDVLEDLPAKREYVVRVPLSAWQRLLYRQILNKSLKVRDSTSGRVTQQNISNTLMQLRKAVNHPYLFLDMYNLDDGLFRASGKFELLDRILTKLLQFNHKILIFSQMTSLMDVLADYLEFRELPFYRLDGSVMLSDRQEIMAKFNEDADGARIFMLSTRAGGLGLNLQSGDTVILFDSDWNPHADLQAQARVHRVGQKREVLVLRFITDSPIEEMILAKAQHKLSIDQQIIQAGMFSNQLVDEDQREQNLRQLLSQKDTQGLASLTTPPQLVRAIARTEQELEKFAAMDRELFGPEIYDSWPGEISDPESESDGCAASRVSEIHKEQVKRDNDRVCELLELAGRLYGEAEIPADVREVNPDKPAAEVPVVTDGTRTVRRSRLRAQRQILKRTASDEEEDIDFDQFGDPDPVEDTEDEEEEDAEDDVTEDNKADAEEDAAAAIKGEELGETGAKHRARSNKRTSISVSSATRSKKRKTRA